MRKLSIILLLTATILFSVSCGNAQNNENQEKETSQAVDENLTEVTYFEIIEYAVDDHLLLKENH